MKRIATATVDVCLGLGSDSAVGISVHCSRLTPALPSQGHLPFAVVGSTEEVKIGNKMVKARQYPWGTVQGER